MLTSIPASKAVVAAIVALHVGSVSSMIVPFKRQSTTANTDDPFNFNIVNWDGDGDIIYTANITLGGQSFEVCIFALSS